MIQIEVGGQALTLLPDKAAFLPRQHILLVADAHIGKAQSFRALGVPVPEGATHDTLERLSALIERLQARRVIFLGDFLHSAHAHKRSTQAALSEWRVRHAAIGLTLVRGNHDDRAGDPPPSLGFQVVDEPLLLDGLALVHHPQAVDGAYALGGHLHPCFTVGGRAFDRLRLPCFHFGERVGVLPAFGSFTGMHGVRPQPDERVYVIAEGQVREAGGDAKLPGP